MENRESNHWLDTIDSTYKPQDRQIAVPDTAGLSPRPLWRRPASVIVTSLVLIMAAIALGLGL